MRLETAGIGEEKEDLLNLPQAPNGHVNIMDWIDEVLNEGERELGEDKSVTI